MCEWPKLRGEVLILAANETTGGCLDVVHAVASWSRGRVDVAENIDPFGHDFPPRYIIFHTTISRPSCLSRTDLSSSKFSHYLFFPYSVT